MDIERQKLVERLLKLLALAQGSSFKAEAATARRMAEELIAKHNLELPSAKDRTAIVVAEWRPTFAGAKWEFLLADAVGKLCGVETLRWGGDALVRLGFVGTVADVEVARYLLELLHRQRLSQWVRAKAQGMPDKFYSFCYSFARGVEAQTETRVGIEEKRRRQVAHDWFGKHRSWGKPHDLGIRGDGRSAAGRAAGEQASLHRGEIGAAPAPKRLTHP